MFGQAKDDSTPVTCNAQTSNKEVFSQEHMLEQCTNK
jgi:hypothetical protein